MGLWGLAVCGIAYGWLGPVGYALWFLCLLAGTVAVCIIGHGILFILPLLLILDIMERWRNRGDPS